MSAFCVFGMTLAIAKKRAEKKLSDTSIPMDQWNERVLAEAEKILAHANPTQVSPPFDAPQFARDWIEVAKRTSRISGAKVMARKPKKDKHGNPVISKATGLPALGWEPY
jgi:hypothetical protein